MDHPVPTEVLKYAREAAGIRQSALSKMLDTNPSVVSRLEKAGMADSNLALRYLEALNTPLAAEIITFYERQWERSSPPSFLHPNREQLWLVEQARQALDTFEKGPQNAPILSGPIAILREDLDTTVHYLERLDHTVAWVGDIGVGKTTALAFATSILVNDSKGQPRPVFPVGSGRTTVCETVIKAAPAFGVAVEPLDEDDIRSLTRDLVMGLKPGPGGVPIEIARVIRNMSGYKVTRMASGDDFIVVDPIAQLMEKEPDIDKVVDALIAAMSLPARKETQLVLSEEAGDGREWLAQTITKINNGAHERFSAPKRITVLLPSDLLGKGGAILNVVDTKGIEAITQRPDLRAHMDDPRTLIVLCAKFADAPGTTIQRLLKENEEAGSDAAEQKRLCILVLPRNDEALQIMADGEPPQTRQEGYAIRRDDVHQALSSASLPTIPTLFFDAHCDPSVVIWSNLRKQVEAMRDVSVQRLLRTVEGVNHLIGNVDVAVSKASRAKIEKDADRLVERVKDLPSTRRPAHDNLIAQFDLGHQSSIAASIHRRGDWGNFPILHILGIGVRNDAHLRTIEKFRQIEYALVDWRQEHADVADVAGILEGLRTRTREWRQDFLAAAQSIGRSAFKSTLEEEQELWNLSADRYGEGPGYKKDLAVAWKNFFETAKAEPGRKSVDDRLARAWQEIVVGPLVEATRAHGQ